MIKSYCNFINENKLFIYNRQFRILDLLETTIYPKRLVKRWMKEYNFDEFAHCLFVTEEPITSDSKKIVISKSSRDIKNKISFNNQTKKYEGWMPPDSKIERGDDEVYLYIFKKNSNKQNRARQIHGFIYEGQIKRLNGLAKFKKTHKWDAEGGLDKNYLNYRIGEGKNVDFFDGDLYQSISIKDEVSGISEANINIIPSEFFDYHNWSIKCMKTKTDVEMGDFKRISGIEKVGSKIKILKTLEKNFILSVAFHDGTENKNILEEYLILMPVPVWKTYLPNLELKLDDITKMYNDLYNHKLIGERTEESELDWQNYMTKYKTITDSSVIKLRFKRDSKGQLRIQCSFSYNIFKSLVLKNPHIRIT